VNKPQPLKGKEFSVDITGAFYCKDVASAVEWLKQELMKDDSIPYCPECEQLEDLFDLIDEAFADVVKKGKEEEK
jgi:hypothetical protein